MSDYGGDDEPMDYAMGECASPLRNLSQEHWGWHWNRENDDNLIDENDLVEQDIDGPDNEGGANGDLDGDDMGNIVTSGDISAQERAAKSLNTVKGVKDKKISTENRSTTPYMTKYERARVLGTRALQIRWVGLWEATAVTVLERRRMKLTKHSVWMRPYSLTSKERPTRCKLLSRNWERRRFLSSSDATCPMACKCDWIVWYGQNWLSFRSYEDWTCEELLWALHFFAVKTAEITTHARPVGLSTIPEFSETFEKRDSEAFGVNVWRAARAAPRLY
jgi:hypothetical protein